MNNKIKCSTGKRIGIFVIRKRHAAIGAGEYKSAVTAGNKRGIPSPVKKQNRLLTAFDI